MLSAPLPRVDRGATRDLVRLARRAMSAATMQPGGEAPAGHVEVW